MKNITLQELFISGIESVHHFSHSFLEKTGNEAAQGCEQSLLMIRTTGDQIREEFKDKKVGNILKRFHFTDRHLKKYILESVLLSLLQEDIKFHLTGHSKAAFNYLLSNQNEIVKKQEGILKDFLRNSFSNIDKKRILEQFEKQKVISDKFIYDLKDKIQKEMLLALLPIQLMVADGVVSDSRESVIELKNSLDKILILILLMEAGDRESSPLFPEITALNENVTRWIVIDEFNSRLKTIIREQSKYHYNLIQSALNNNIQWQDVQCEICNYVPEWINILQILDDIKIREFKNVKEIWNQVVHNKTWFKLYNLTVS